MTSPVPSTTVAAPVNQLPKLGILEEDDEFEEFPIEGCIAGRESDLTVARLERVRRAQAGRRAVGGGLG